MFEGFTNWLAARALRRNGRPIAQSTVTTKVAHLRRTIDLLGGSDTTTLDECLSSRAGVERVLDVFYARHKPSTVRVDVQSLKDYGAYAVAAGLIERHYVLPEDFPKQSEQTAPIRTYSESDTERLLLFAEVLCNLRFRVLLETIAGTGIRIGEALGLTWDDLRLEAETPHLVLTRTKNGKPALVPLNRRLREVIYTPENLAALRELPLNGNAVKDPAVYLFPMGYNASVHKLAKLCRRCGVEVLGWHAFRHSHATRLLQEGVPVHAVSKLLNHSSVAVTQRFYDATISLDFARYLD